MNQVETHQHFFVELGYYKCNYIHIVPSVDNAGGAYGRNGLEEYQPVRIYPTPCIEDILKRPPEQLDGESVKMTEYVPVEAEILSNSNDQTSS